MNRGVTQRAKKAVPLGTRPMSEQDKRLARLEKQAAELRKTQRAKVSKELEKRREGALKVIQPIRPPSLLAVRAAPEAPLNPKIPKGDFWLNILKDVNVPDDQKEETIEAIQKLAFFDSIHDFWPERGKKKTTDEDEIEPQEIDPQERIDAVHEKLVESIRTYAGVEAGVSIEAILQGTTEKSVYSVSGIEDRVLMYFKQRYPPFNEKEVIITVDDILTNWKLKENFNDDWEAYKSAILQLPSAIEVLISGKHIKSLETKELGYLGFFILAFMNPSENPGTTTPMLTFDMGPRDIGKIFERFTQVKNAIYPQNVADSATTSFTALLGRAEFFRANYTPSGEGKEEIEHVARSNAFTRDKYDIVFVDKGFGLKNRFGFSIEIRDKQTGNVVATIPFGKGKEQGPSVNYLMDLLITPDPRTVVPKLDTVAEFSGIRKVDPDLLFDVKRLGDQEQMMVTTAYGVTGDRFAGAFRRMLRMPGIFHSSKGFRIWRGAGVIDEATIKKNAREFRKSKVIQKLKLVSGILKADEILNELEQMKEQVDSGAQAGTVFYREEGFQFGGLLTPEFLYENYTKIAERFATYVLRKRMQDISTHIDKLVARIDSFRVNLPEYDAAACVIEQPQPSKPEEPCPAAVAPPDDEVIDAALDKLEEFLEGVDELKKMNISFFASKNPDGTITETAEPIYTELFDENGRLIKGVTSSLFNFSAGPFHHPETGLSTAVAKLLHLASTTRRIATVAPQINKLLVQYFQARDEIKEAFLNDDLKAEIEAQTDITSGPTMTPARVVTAGNDGRQGLLEVLENLAAEFEAGDRAQVGPGEGPAEGLVGGADGVPGYSLQYRDLHDLFAKLCLQTEVTMNRINTKYEYDISTGVTEEDATVASLNEAADALNDIETTWVTEVEQLRVHAEDDYGVPFEESVATDLVSFLLSFRTTEAGVDNDILFRVGAEETVRRRDVPRFEDIRLKLLQKVPVEPFILEILATVGTDILTLANTNEIGDTYAAPAKWRDELPNALYVATAPSAEALALVRGGGLEGGEDTPPNAVGTGGSSSRRRLYAGLRKRVGSGTPPELRE